MDRQRYLELIAPAVEIVAKKGEDYNQGAASLEQYFPFRDFSYIQMIHLKAKRLVSLVSLDNKEPNFESIEDTLYDLLNYTVFYLAYIRNQQDV